MPDLADMLDVITAHDRMCDVCRFYCDPCEGHVGVRGGPNGPIFPICVDHDDFIDEEMVEEIYNEIMEDTDG